MAHLQGLINIRTLILVILIGIAAHAGYKVFKIETERRATSADLVELSKAKYGLFNVDEWKAIIATVVTKKVEELDLSETNKAEMRKRISTLLYKIVGDLEKSFKNENKGKFLGFFKNAGAKFMDIFGNMRRNIPEFTEQIIKFLEDPQNRKDLKTYIMQKVDSYTDDTFAKTDYTLHDAILAQHGYSNRADAIKQLGINTTLLNFQKKPYTYTLYLIFLIFAIWMLVMRPRTKVEWVLIIAATLLPLFLGVQLPMIEIDARIAELKFQLLGEDVGFTDQVLFFKSKSILEVVQLMFAQGKADLMAVGILVMAFSVLFPFAKISASLIYVLGPRFRENSIVQTVVFKTGKWSMADVMVVAIFMSYIGFSGIISEQLTQLEGIAKNADVLTTNQSSLQSGFFMFSSFVLLGLLVSNGIVGIRRNEGISAANV